MKSVGWLALVCALGRAQGQAPAPIHVDVNLVQVDATVTDSRNHHVSNLKAEDFDVLQDGKPQKITNFAYIAAEKPAAPPASAAAATKGKSSAAVPMPVAPLKAAEVRRTIALVVDDLGLAFESMAHVREALRKFVDQQMQPGDLVAIIRTSGGLGVLQQFTNDKNLLHAAIDHVRFTIGRVGVDSFPPVEIVDPRKADHSQPLFTVDPDAAIDDLRSQMFTVGTLGALEYVVDGLGDFPGRKAVVLFSEDLELVNMTAALPAGPQTAGFQSLSGQVATYMQRLVDAANRASVVVYTIDPRGVIPFSFGANDTRPTPKTLMEQQTKWSDSQTGLRELADQTGGLFIHDDNYVDDALSQVIADSDGYYLIGYHPDSGTFDNLTETKFHRLQVRTKIAGLHVRSRSGFFGETDADARAVPRSSHDDLMHALTSPFNSGEVPVRLTALFDQTADGRPYLTGMLYIDPKGLKFVAQPDGGQKATLEVAAMTFGQSGKPVDQSDRRFEIALNREQYAAVPSAGLVYRIAQPLQSAGAYQVRVALRDEGSGQLGSASQFLQTPDLKNGRLALSSIVLAANIGRDGDSSGEGRLAPTDPLASAAERVFKPGMALSYRYTVFNARSDPAGKADLEVRIRIFRDGKPVYEGQPLSPQLSGQASQKHLEAGGNMVLTKGSPPGDYVLQVIVSDKLAPKSQTASQWMDFEIEE